MSITRVRAEAFADQWIAAWNAHDLEAIMSHYADDLLFYSPMVTKITGEPSGCLKGKQAVRHYWRQALTLAPELAFTSHEVFVGIRSVTIVYQGVRGPVAEVFEFNEHDKVYRATAHY